MDDAGLAAQQAAADAAREARRRQSAALIALKEPSVALHDAREALFGIPSDLLGNDVSRRSLRATITHENRLRGIGVIFVLVGVITLALEAVI